MQQKFLEFIVDDQFIRAPHYTVVADSRDYLVARFSFSEHWQGLTKTAVFQGANGKAYFVVLDKDTCPIPWEVIQPTRFLVSVFGGDRLTADRAMVEVAASGFTASGITPPAPTPDVYNQLTEAVALERQLAENAATTATEKAEQCVYLTSSAESLLQEAANVDALVAAAKQAAQQAATCVAQTEENAAQADASAQAAQQSEDAANAHATASYTFSEEAKTAADEAKTAAAQLEGGLQQLESIQAGLSRQLLATVIVENPTSTINIAFEKPVKDFFLVFKGQLVADAKVSNAILACHTDRGSQYFFYATDISFPAGENVAYIAHARHIADHYWMTDYATGSLNAGLQGISSSSSAAKTSYSRRSDTLPLYVNSICFFEFNQKYTFAAGSTVEVWGIYAE